MASTSYTPNNRHRQYTEFMVDYPAADVDTDGSGDFTVTFGGARGIMEPSVVVTLEGGYSARVMSVTGNAATVRIFRQGITTGSTAAGAVGNGCYVSDTAAAETVARIGGTATSTTYDWGAMKACTTQSNIAILHARALGW